jgi:hypothetical protein
MRLKAAPTAAADARRPPSWRSRLQTRGWRACLAAISRAHREAIVHDLMECPVTTSAKMRQRAAGCPNALAATLARCTAVRKLGPRRPVRSPRPASASRPVGPRGTERLDGGGRSPPVAPSVELLAGKCLEAIRRSEPSLGAMRRPATRRSLTQAYRGFSCDSSRAATLGRTKGPPPRELPRTKHTGRLAQYRSCPVKKPRSNVELAQHAPAITPDGVRSKWRYGSMHQMVHDPQRSSALS